MALVPQRDLIAFYHKTGQNARPFFMIFTETENIYCMVKNRAAGKDKRVNFSVAGGMVWISTCFTSFFNRVFHSLCKTHVGKEPVSCVFPGILDFLCHISMGLLLFSTEFSTISVENFCTVGLLKSGMRQEERNF